MTDFVYGNGDTVGYSDGDIATAGVATVANVDATTRTVGNNLGASLLPAGVKPTGPVEIDWDHPLTRGLQCSLTEHGNAVDGTALNLGPKGEVLTTSKGLAISTATSTAFGEAAYAEAPSAKIVNEFTLFFIGDVSNSEDGDGFVHLAMNTANAWGPTLNIQKGYWTPTLKIRVYFDASTIGQSHSNTIYPITDTGVHSYLVTRKSNVVNYYLEDSVDLAWSDTTFPSNDFTDTGRTLVGTGYFSEEEVGGQYNAGAFCLFLVWDRVLTDSELESITRDPYQFLKTSAPRINAPIVEAEVSDRLWIL